MIRKYHNHKLQANPWHREEEQQKQSNQFSLSRQDDCKTRKDIFLSHSLSLYTARPSFEYYLQVYFVHSGHKIMHNKTMTNTELPQTIGGT